MSIRTDPSGTLMFTTHTINRGAWDMEDDVDMAVWVDPDGTVRYAYYMTLMLPRMFFAPV